MITTQLFLALVGSGAFGAIGSELVRSYRAKQHDDHEHHIDDRNAAVNEFERIASAYRDEIDRLTARVYHLETMVTQLSAQIIDLGGNPYRLPPTKDS